MSLYEGRTRGKRIRYTFSDDEDAGSDAFSGLRSRNSGISTPAEATGPVVTASGRHVRPRAGGVYGESLLSGQQEDMPEIQVNGVGHDNTQDTDSHTRSGRAVGISRAGRSYHRSYNAVDEMDEESDAPSSEWDSGKEADEDANDNVADGDDENDEMSVNALDRDDEEASKRSLVVSLKIGKPMATSFKPETPNQQGPDERATMNGTSPASSTIVVNNEDPRQNRQQPARELHSPQPQTNALKVEHIITPLQKPTQAPTPPLSDSQLTGKFDEVSLIEQPFHDSTV